MSHAEIADFAALPAGSEGGWHRLRVGSGTALAWVVTDCPALGLIAAWPSRQAAEAGEVHRAIVYTAAEFAAAADPVEAVR